MTSEFFPVAAEQRVRADAPEKRGGQPHTVSPEADSRPYLEVAEVTKKFARFTALHQVSFQAERGDFICILGPSGCGKTTLLRVIAGLEKQDSGQVFFQGRDVSRLSTARRNVGIVFQSYALFPNLTAIENIGYGLKSRKLERDDIRKRVDELLQLVGLRQFGDKFPAQLSGGQQQRVALARAMALSPAFLLLDEPLSALDAQVRVMLRGEIKQLQRQLNVTTIMVTHDQEEALTMGDRILVMDRGTIVQSGTPTEIYDEPATPFVASFVGSMNFLENATGEAAGVCRIGHLRLNVKNGHSPVALGKSITVAIRPEDVVVREASDMPNTVTARVRGLEFRGSLYRATLAFPTEDGKTCTVRADIPSEIVRRSSIEVNEDLRVAFPPDRIRVYAA
jgi:iron(III) transport system ATP-binding protein